MTPQDMHYGRATQILRTRTAALDAAFEVHPERFKGKRPTLKNHYQRSGLTPRPISLRTNRRLLSYTKLT